jgi:hypothetical protein
MADNNPIPSRMPLWPTVLLYAGGGLFIGAIAGHQYLPALMSLQPALCALAGGAIGAIAGAIAGISAAREAAQHTEAVQQVAQKLGGQYLPADAELNRRLGTDFNLSNAAMYNVVSKDLNGARAEIGDLQITTKSGTGNNRDTTTVTQSAAFFTADGLRLPHFFMQPEGTLLKLFARVVGGEKIEFPAQPYFSEIYHLSGNHPENTRRLFDDGVLNSLVRRPGLRIQSAADALLIYQPGRLCERDELESFIAEATQIFRLFEASARRMKQEDETRVTPKADVRAIAENMPGLMGRIVRANLVTHPDLSAFVSQATPRKIPANILKYRERVVPRAFLFVGMFLVIFGALWVWSVQTNGAGQPMTIGLVQVAIGVVIALFAGWARMRFAGLLRHGQLGTAVIESIVASQWKGRLRIVARCQAEGRSWRATSTWYLGGNAMGEAEQRARDLAAKKKPAPILYDPAAPQRILFVDALLTVSAEYEP